MRVLEFMDEIELMDLKMLVIEIRILFFGGSAEFWRGRILKNLFAYLRETSVVLETIFLYLLNHHISQTFGRFSQKCFHFGNLIIKLSLNFTEIFL